MIKFYKEHKWLTWLLIVSIFIIGFYLATLDIPEIFRHAGDMLFVAETLSLSYIASFIFFLVQVYFPDKRKQEKIDKCICVYIDGIVYGIRHTIDAIAAEEVGHDAFSKPYTKDELIHISMFTSDTELKNMANISQPIVGENGKMHFKNSTVRECLLQGTADIENKIDRLMSFYGTNVSPELISALEGIRYTAMMGAMRNVFQAPINVRFDSSNNDFLYSFYEAGENLKKIRDKEFGF